MKLYKSMLAAATLILSAGAFTACNEDLEMPPIAIPSTDVKANTTILDFKKKYWSNDNNYCTLVEKNDKGEDIIIGGRIIASDEGGNIYQNLMLQDASGAITIAVQTSSTLGLSNLHTRYKVGEEMYINVTGLYAGKYAGLFQIGTKGDYNGTPQTSKMSATDFLAHTYLNGLPDPSALKVTKMTIAEINAATSPDEVQALQSQLVAIDNVSWIGGGTDTWAVQGSSGDNRYLIDADGNKLLVRNSGKSDFNQDILPAGHGNVEGILSYYNGSWQFLFRSPDDCTDFGGESYAPQMVGTGTADDPFQVSSMLAGASGSGVWVTGYIVGWVEGQVLSEGAHFSVPASSKSNLLLAATPDETNVAACVPVQLTSGSAVRTALNLQDNPGNLGKQVTIKGDCAAYFGAAGLKTTTAYVWGDKGDDSSTPSQPETPAGNAKFQKATSVTAGKTYLLVSGTKAALPITAGTYGYLKVTDVTDNAGVIETAAANGFTFTQAAGGFYIADSNGKYLIQTGTFNSFNLSESATDEGIWTVEAQADGTFKITNTNVNKYIQYSSQYTSFGSYSSTSGDMPVLYEKIN